MGKTLASNIGLTVIDKRGKNRGVIIGVNEKHPNELMIRAWSDEHQRYLLWSKHYKLIGHIPESSAVNEKDPEYNRILRDSCLELALMTGDKDWFDQLHSIKA